MRHVLPTIALAGGLAGCANVHERPVDLHRIGLGEDDVLRVERENLALRRSQGRRPRIGEIDAVEKIRCVTMDYNTISLTPRCDYRIRYRRPDGTPATKTRRRQHFERGGDGRWESVIIVTG